MAPAKRERAAYSEATAICDEDAATCKAIGGHGSKIIRQIWEDKGQPDRINVLTHCNAGWLATVDWGTALAPIYLSFDAGVPAPA